MPGTRRAKQICLTAGLAAGTLNPIVGRELPLPDAPRAHELLGQGGALGKIVLVP